MPKSFFVRGMACVGIAGFALSVAACNGDENALYTTRKDAHNASGYYKALRCGKSLQTVDINVGSTSNSLGLKATVTETNDTYGQVKVVVTADVPTDKELPLIIIHAIGSSYGYDAEDDQKLEPAVAAGGKLDSQLSTDQYAQWPASGGKITGVTLCVGSVDASTATNKTS